MASQDSKRKADDVEENKEPKLQKTDGASGASGITREPAAPAGGTAPAEQEKPAEPKTHPHGHAGETGDVMLESGLIYFFYRPRVQTGTVTGVEDVQRLYLLLCPKVHEGKNVSNADSVKRLIIIGRKALPPIKEGHTQKDRVWCFVDMVTKNIDEIDEVLGKQSYSTGTRGERTIDPARPCGEGMYALVKMQAHTHLAYVLELPTELGDVQHAFNIEKEGSYIISVKNPEVAAPTGFGLGPKEKTRFPERLEKIFQGRRWSSVVDPEFLDYTGAELLLIGVSNDVEQDLGEMGAELKKLERLDAKKLSENKLFKELHMNKSEHPSEPLTSGAFK